MMSFAKLKIVVLLYLFASTCQVWAVTLEFEDQQYQIDPATLQISMLLDDKLVEINAGVAVQPVENLKHSSNELQWYWPTSGSHITITVQHNDLYLRIINEQDGNLHWYSLPASSQFLLMPLSEGMRIDINNPQWLDYLVNSFGEVNTTYDLKMPFWSQQQGDKVFSWVIPPYYNTLAFSQVQQRLVLTASHQFKAKESYEVILHTGTDELSGARRYRQYLQDHKQFIPLSEKFAANPQGKKLIGALHTYLFGDALLDKDDIQDWSGLITYLTQPEGKTLTQYFDKEASTVLVELNQHNTKPFGYQQWQLTSAINLAMDKLYPAYGDANSQAVIEQQYQAIQQQQRWLEQHLGPFLQAQNRRGQGVSVPVIEALTKAGLNNLWLGVNKWTSAFANPQAIEAAKHAGYLIGPYDSYNTAIPKGLNDTWLSARLPDDMREQCAVILADGSKQKGFQKSGHYLNPNCHTATIYKRIGDILRLGKFNSYFIDVDATGMVRDDFNSKNPSSAEQMTEHYNQRMQWIAEKQHSVLGSEDGNAITQQGVMFAHGMETVGFGWGDQDMRKNRQSPYYLGPWYPDHKPEFFFRPAQVKAPYKYLLFAPENRLPLYQSVYHDSLINSHHWTMDNLKFSDVKAQRDLIGMLYNTPPMVNLSRDDMQQRIKALQHYQQGFSPAHQQLWDKALVKLLYLTEDKQVQQTHFSDGSKITGNFSQHAFVIGDATLAAQSALVELVNKPPFTWFSEP
ncbi:glycoside hydrolase [Paraglaciecola hydrolytica]|uniref:Glycosyl hydrolase n=1 Tax=Paraglaciecola hydrolytica TaxID=1799789 RepID=A0A135ZZL1_9ALTE|nr:glycoside hydrolase [Paraglaciecola hydrolytica]KXI28429.1 hypothetical protein AX660_15115 [Paraglaciecola hydrolytica]